MKSVNQNKIAIVTGGGSGIGFAIAQKFTENSIKTIIVGRDKQKLKHAKEKLGELCMPCSLDLADLSAIPFFIEDCVKQFGGIDILVNNAGIMDNFVPAADLTDELWERVFAINTTGPVPDSAEKGAVGNRDMAD